jgi:glycosyltransferase involved in cell wall biosynthesis
MRFSIIVLNYNYARFVRNAIESALAIDWQDKEIIVVDDGSTDDSPSVISSYNQDVIKIFKQNGGQSSACNAGFVRCSGDVIIFLDADDVLLPSVGKVIDRVWYESVSKVQFTLSIVDAELRPLGVVWPRYVLPQTPTRIRQIQRRTGRYLHSPTSGNAWNRSFLAKVFPLKVREATDPVFRHGCNGDCRVPTMDNYLSQLAPFFGDVLCIDHNRPQGLYRLHGNNYSFWEHFGAFPEFMELFCSARNVNDTLDRLHIAHYPLDVESHEYFMRLYLICRRWDRKGPGGSCLPSWSGIEALRKYWRTILIDEESTATSKIKWYLWSVLVAGAPDSLARWAVRTRERRTAFAKAARATIGPRERA